ncbi:unnamed protein product [Rotaria sp. Silwood1]|nr:unnamed protein product [Rotaria sp. Silwood1]
MIVLLDILSPVKNIPCSGSILNDYFILTAARCVEKLIPLHITIKAGIHYSFDQNATTRDVDRIYLHPQYKGHTDGYANDIALLELSESLNLNDNSFITPTCIPKLNASINISQYPKNTTRLAVMGWNSIKQGSVDIFQALQQGEIFAIDNNDPMCLRSLIDREKQFCAGSLKDGRDPCYGDTGGPILQWMDNRWEQVGIASYSRCGIPGYPSIYTRLAYYINWINSITITHNESLYTTTTRSPPVTYNCDRNNVTCGCGYRPVQISTSRIIGGENAIPNSWSMIVSIRGKLSNSDINGKHICGGTIINEWYIITAAHCVDQTSLIAYSNITVSIGLYNQSELNHKLRSIQRIILHPLWRQGKQFSNDIALLHLSEALDFQTNPFITQTCRLRPMNSVEYITNYPLNGTVLATIGWGQLDDGTFPDMLQQVNLYSMHYNDSACAQVIYDYDVQFCAGVYGGRKSVCIGDSGGPIFQWIGNRWEQVGITSYFPNKCTRRGYPAVFTRLASYYDWIEWNINPYNYTTLTSTPPSSSTTTTSQTSSLVTITSTTERPSIRYRCNRTVSCGCGLIDVLFISSEIVDSFDARAFSWTMIVSIRFNDTDQHSCTGTVLADQYILTSARCVQNQSLWKIIVASGVYRLSNVPSRTYQVDRIHQHPHFRKRRNYFENDIALLHLTKPINTGISRLYTRACVPKINSLVDISQYPSNKTQLAIIGWKITKENQIYLSNTLQQAEIVVIDNKDPMCLKSNVDSNKQFCAEFKHNKNNSCPSDSGAPIFKWMDGYWDQVGIISSDRCEVNYQTNIYTRLAYYYDWMTSILNYDNVTMATITQLNATKVPIIYDCSKKKVNCGCGYTNVELIQSRIIGGGNAVEASWTMFVSLRILNSNKHLCGGTLLSESYILTAAHCVQSFSLIDPFDLTIVAGITNRSDASRYIGHVRRIYIHPNFTNQGNRFINDIAILELYDPFLIDSNLLLSRTCVPHISSSILNNQYPINGTRLVIIGWGTIEYEPYVEPDILQQLEIFANDNNHSMCSNLLNNVQSQFCAGVYQERKGPCQGDSGGAIFQWTGEYWQQIGIISSDFTCGNSTILNIYTRLSYYRSWMDIIVSKTGEHLEPTHSIFNTTTIRTTMFSSGHNTNSTQTSIEKITYECDRNSKLCGCSLSNVVLSNYNQNEFVSNIIPSENIYPFSWTMIVSIRIHGYEHICSGTILSDLLILTAAHCFDRIDNYRNIEIFAGMDSLSSMAGTKRKIHKIYIHENYSYNKNYFHDIAIIQVDQPFELNSQPIFSRACLPNRHIITNEYLSKDSKLIVVGWKSSILNNDMSNILQQIPVKLVDNQNVSCSKLIQNNAYQFCAGLIQNGKIPCQGDSGGPIFVYRNTHWEQVGIVSYGDGCSVSGYPKLYTKLSAYVDWINKFFNETSFPIRPLTTPSTNGSFKYQWNIIFFKIIICIILILIN